MCLLSHTPTSSTLLLSITQLSHNLTTNIFFCQPPNLLTIPYGLSHLSNPFGERLFCSSLMVDNFVIVTINVLSIVCELCGWKLDLSLVI